MKLINDQPAVVRADWLEAVVEATRREDLEGRCGGGFEGLVPCRRAPAPVASPIDGGRR
jgi:hypothetical protein